MPVPPSSVREEAQRGLDWRKEYGRGGTPVGWARARDLSGGADIPLATIRRMVSFFARHEIDKQGRGFRVGSEGYPSAGRIAWALWGGDAGRVWAEAQTQRMEKTMSETEPRRPALLRKLRITRVDRVAAGANPEAEIVLFKRAELDETQTETLEASMLSDQENATASETIPSEEQTMSETITADAPALEVDERIAAIEAERDALVAKVADLEAAAQIVAEVEETVAEVAPLDEEEILKALDPSVRERIEKAESERAALVERVAKMEDDAATAEFIAKAAEFKTVNSDADRLGALLKDVAKNCTAESAVTLDEVLKGTAGRLDEAHRLITAELGSVAGLDSTDAGQRIESLAKARSAESGVSMPVATAAILNENPDLYEQARAQRAN